MTRLSESFRRMALRLVERFGKDGYVIRRQVQADSDPETPTKPGEITETDYPCKAAITAYTTEQTDGVQVLRGDQQIVVAYTADLPDKILPGDFFVDGDEIHNIIPPIEEVSVNGILVAYILQARK